MIMALSLSRIAAIDDAHDYAIGDDTTFRLELGPLASAESGAPKKEEPLA
jgi:hypothetical protein